MKDGIEAKKWRIQDLSIDSMINSIQSVKYTLFYQEIIKFIYFIIGYKKFQ